MTGQGASLSVIEALEHARVGVPVTLMALVISLESLPG
jgi:hypothetical protein